MSDPDAIGPDGTVRLRCYLPHENIHWFAAGCTDCGHQAAIGARHPGRRRHHRSGGPAA
jgi:hypothetical protein